jgi:hypothetical protein
MGCNCGGNSGLANYEVVYTQNGEKKTKTFSAVKEVEVTAFAAKNPGSTYRKTS